MKLLNRNVPLYDRLNSPSPLLKTRCFAVGSKDMTTWIFGAERWANLIYYSLGGHKDIIVGCFFEKDSLDVRRKKVSAAFV